MLAEHIMDASTVTLLLRKMDGGDSAAADALYLEVYSDLRRRAAGLMGHEGSSHTLGATGVVHEAWMRVASAGSGKEGWNGRKHFLGVAAKAMRSVLVDHARARATEKRGGGQERVVLDEAVALFETRAIDLVVLDEALEGLAAFDPELARLVELRFFAGLSIAETAQVTGVSTATVERSWRTARAFLRTALDDGESSSAEGGRERA